jgi:hypothetical protein
MEVVDDGISRVCPIKDNLYFDSQTFEVVLKDDVQYAAFIDDDGDEVRAYTLVSVSIMFLRDVYKVN